MTTDDLHSGPAITTIRVCDLHQLERDLAAVRADRDMLEEERNNARAEAARLREALISITRVAMGIVADAEVEQLRTEIKKRLDNA